MIRSATPRERIAWVALVVLLCSLVASVRLRPIVRPRAAIHSTCVAAGRDSARVARLASDTIATLRARAQQVRSFTPRSTGVEVRTEDSDSLSSHDGGLAAFDCAGRLTFLWLDGG